MWKTRIEVKTKIATWTNTGKTALFAIDNQCNKTINITYSNKKAEIDPANMKLVKFSIQIKIFLANNVGKTCGKWAIDDFIKYSNNNLIILLIINIKTEFTTYIVESITICHC